MGACGLTIEQAQMYFIDKAVKSIFRKNPKALRRLVGVVRAPEALPRLRVLSQFQQLAMTEVIQASALASVKSSLKLTQRFYMPSPRLRPIICVLCAKCCDRALKILRRGTPI